MTAAIRELIRLEPVRVRAVIGALIGLALSLGINVDGDGILAFVDAALPLIASMLMFLTARSRVTPVAG